MSTDLKTLSTSELFDKLELTIDNAIGTVPQKWDEGSGLHKQDQASHSAYCFEIETLLTTLKNRVGIEKVFDGKTVLNLSDFGKLEITSYYKSYDVGMVVTINDKAVIQMRPEQFDEFAKEFMKCWAK